MKYGFFLILLGAALLPGSHTAMGQAGKLQFVENRFDKEIVYDQIEDVLIDQDGFVWLATATGLYAYDGYEFELFTHRASGPSISENFATSLFEDQQGNIWVGTFNNGLNLYDKSRKAFYNYRSDGGQWQLNSNKVPRLSKTMAEDADGNIWLSTAEGLNRINPKSKQVSWFEPDLAGQILFDKRRSVLWLVGNEMYKFDMEELKATEVISSADLGICNDVIMDGDGKLWIGTDKGILIYHPDQGSLQSLSDILGIGTLQANHPINGLYLDKLNRIWYGEETNVVIVDPLSRSFMRLEPDGSENGLLGDKITGIYGDRAGKILITYDSHGITEIRNHQSPFHSLSLEKGRFKKRGANVRSVYYDDHQNLWYGTYNHGLNSILSDGATLNFRHDPDNRFSLSADFITAIFQDAGGRFWIGTFEDGYCFTDQIDKARDLLFTRSGHEGKMEVHEFTERIPGEIWISTDRGFVIYDKSTGISYRYGEMPGEHQELGNINIQAVSQQNDTVLWFASWNRGVGKLVLGSDREPDQVTLYEKPLDLSGRNIDGRFINICQDRDGIIWLASSVNGLVRMDPSGPVPSFSFYDESMGAPSNIIYAIIEDSKGKLWVSSPNGIGRFDKRSGRFTNFYESDGLAFSSFIWDSYARQKNGRITFGGVNGLIHFHPDSVKGSGAAAAAYLSGLSINHNEIQIGEAVNGRVLLPLSLRFTDALRLRHDESNFSLEFAALPTVATQEVKFSYQLEGFDQDWIIADHHNRQATYTNVPAGEYFFRVRASRTIGQWGDEVAMLPIKVLPPYWKTWWAYAIYIILIIVLSILIYQELVKRSVLKHKLALEQYKHDRDNELNREKFRFFTNLSHELRTPLTLIVGPLGRMLDKKEVNTRTRHSLVLMQKQAIRLQKLTNQLMNFRKYEIDNLQLKAAEGNIVDFVEEIYVAFRQHAKHKGIHFERTYSDNSILAYYDRDKLEIVLVNLLSNAFKFTPEKGTVEIRIDTKSIGEVRAFVATINGNRAVYGEIAENVNDLIEICVRDSGVGISDKQLSHVFDRYFQASNIQSISVGGTGIGLEITKNYVELHHGQIMAESEEGHGTTFHIWLPLGGSHLTEMEVIRDFKPSEDIDQYQYDTEAVTEAPTSEHYTIPVVEGQSVLIVDDNPDIIMFLKESFQESYQVITAQHGREGLDKALEHLPDLIISDIMMPEMDGLEFCDTLKQDVRTSHIPVILLTARTANVFQVEGLETGADDYLTKPFDEKILKLRVRNLIESRQKLRARYSKEEGLAPADIALTSPDEKFLKDVIAITEANLSNSDLKVEWLAREVGVSHSVLYKKIQALTDLTVVEFVRSIRLKKAAILLTETRQKVNEISTAVGFSDAKYFSKCFQAFYGKKPSEFRGGKN